MKTPNVLLAALLFLTIFINCLTQLSTAAKQPSPSVDWAKTVVSGKERTTTLQFYFHDVVSGKNPTAVMLIPPSNVTHPAETGFGALVIVDDKLTVGPKPTSKEVGRAQGLYGAAGKNEVGLLMAISYCFTDGVYNGSSISILGRNTASNQVHEMPVVGGTGVFRMARGYVLARTLEGDPKTGDAVVGYNVTLIH